MKKYNYRVGTDNPTKEIDYFNVPKKLRVYGMIANLKEVYKGETNNEWQ